MEQTRKISFRVPCVSTTTTNFLTETKSVYSDSYSPTELTTIVESTTTAEETATDESPGSTTNIRIDISALGW